MLGLGNLGRMVFGSANERRLKRYQPIVATINGLEAESAALSDAELRAKTDAFRQQVADGADLDDLLPRSLRHRPRGRQAHARPAPFRRPADRRHGAARRLHRRDEDRRRQDARRHPPRLPERARRQGRPRRHRQRLPRPPRRRMDGPDLPVPRPDRRRHRPRPRSRRSAARPTPPTSPTAPTTNSASTICATT